MINATITRKTNTMKLTKLQRYTAYCILMYEFEIDDTAGFCLIWEDLFKEMTWRKGDIHLSYYLPELWGKRTYKNPTHTDSWFSNEKKRITALKTCIAETEPK